MAEQHPCQQNSFHSSVMIIEQVICDLHGSCIYCMWNLNQEPELPVPKQVCQPCQNVLPFTRIYRTNLMFNGRPLYKHYGLWWKFQLSGQHFTCLASHMCHFCAHEQLLLLCCKWNFVLCCVLYMNCVHKNFRAVSWHQSRATDLKVGVKGCD